MHTAIEMKIGNEDEGVRSYIHPYLQTCKKL